MQHGLLSSLCCAVLCCVVLRHFIANATPAPVWQGFRIQFAALSAWRMFSSCADLSLAQPAAVQASCTELNVQLALQKRAWQCQHFYGLPD